MRIIVADHNRKTLWALRTLLEEESDMEVVGEAQSRQELQILAKEFGADLILLDSQLCGREAKALIMELHGLKPKPIVIAMSSNNEDGRPMLRAGADVFISKGEEPVWLLDTLRRYKNRNSQVNNVR
jgi:DNA-binding NarL/FixJ family response regulator